MTKTPIIGLEKVADDQPRRKGTFWVNVLFIGIGVVPIEVMDADCLSDVLCRFHAPDPNDRYFDGFSESRQAMRVYWEGVATVGERQATVTADLIKGLKTQ